MSSCALSRVPLLKSANPQGLELEDIDHIFDKGGITGGVLGAKGGKTVRRSVDKDRAES
jgi:hypothetical protein